MNNKGNILLEMIVVLIITGLIISVGYSILLESLKCWNNGEANFEVQFNSREAINKLMLEIRDSCGVEILDSSDNGWIKIYKSLDHAEFVTFRKKNDKLFIGYNNVLNSNSELSNYIKCFKISYLPEGVSEAKYATGVTIDMLFEKDNKKFEKQLYVAFRF